MNKDARFYYILLFLLNITSFISACSPAIPSVHCESDADCPRSYHCDLEQGAYCIANVQTEDSGSSDAAGIADSGPRDQARPDSSVASDAAQTDSAQVADAARPDQGLQDASIEAGEPLDSGSGTGEDATSDASQQQPDATLADHVMTPDAMGEDNSTPSCDPAACPSSVNPCLHAGCINGACGFVASPNGSSCRPAIDINNGNDNFGVCEAGECHFKCFINSDFVSAGAKEDPDNPCRYCRPNVSRDSYSDAPNDTLCNADSLFCTAGDSCQQGSCVAGDASPCTSEDAPICIEDTDRCVECQEASDCADDNLFCNGDKACNNGVCVQTGNPCSPPLPSCLESTDSCVQCQEDNDCADDGLFCTGIERCNGYSCVQTGNPCSGIQPRCVETSDACSCTDTSCPAWYSCNGSGRCARTQTFDLENNNQDGFQDPYHNNTVLGVGESYYFMSLYDINHIGGLRYKLGIPQGAHIISAKLRVNLNNEDADTSNMGIYAEASDNAAAMAGNISYELSSKTKTTHSAHWGQNNMGVGWHDTSDISEVVQEIVNRSGWQLGNHILLLLYNSSSLDFYQRDVGASYGAKLDVTWEIGE